MIQNSLDRLFGGIAESLREVVLPALDDPFAQAQVRACIELIGNIGARVEWSRQQVDEVVERAAAALREAVAVAPDMSCVLGATAGASSPLERRDRALADISTALRWCDTGPDGDRARVPLVVFARWHLESELGRLRTGMFRG